MHPNLEVFHVIISRGRTDRTVVTSSENLPNPVGFVDASNAAERYREADPSLIIKVKISFKLIL